MSTLRPRRVRVLRRAVTEVLESRTLLSTSYSITDLGTLPGGDFSDATAINASGVVVGYSHISDGSDRAFLWTASGGMQDLGTLSGDLSSRAQGINSAGDVVGFSTNSSGVDRAFLWTAAAGMREIDTLLGGAANEAFAINDSDQIVGQAIAGGGTQHAFLFNATGGGQDLGTLGTAVGDYSFATAINNAGQVVGLTENDLGDYHAFLWTAQTGMQDLGALNATDTATAFGINANGLIVGSSGIGQSTTPFLYTAGGTGGPAFNPPMQPLGNLGGASNQAYAINASGQIVGFSETGVTQSTDAAIWDNSTVPQDLNKLIPAHSGWGLDQGNAINDLGVIVGEGPSPSGQNHGFLLTPVGLFAPGAVVSAPDLNTVGATETITVTFISDAAAIDTSTIDASNLTVTDSNGATLGLTLGGLSGAGNSVTATYIVAPPGGSWDSPDTGTYTVTVLANSVKDASGAGVQPVTTSFDVDFTADVTFCPTTNGTVALPFSVEQVIQKPDGNILSVGHRGDTAAATSQGVLESFTSASMLDPNFATASNGVISTNAGDNDAFYAAAIQNDGKIVAVGASNGKFFVARYNADGSTDTNFGAGGIATTDFGSNGPATASTVAIATNGDIVVGGNGNGVMALARFTSAGTLDPTFNDHGTADPTYPAGGQRIIAIGPSITVTQLLIQGDGKILLVGNNGANVAVARVNADGSDDLSFGSGGVVTLSQLVSQSGDGTSNVESLAIAGSGSILVGGQIGGGGLGAVRLTPAGQVDATFGSSGAVDITFGGSNDRTDNIIFNPTDGSILLIGTTDVTGTTQTAVADLNPDGSLNTSFGVQGKSTLPPISSAASSARARAFHPQLIDFAFGDLQNDGRVLVGQSNASGSFVRRLQPVTAGSTMIGNPFGRIGKHNVKLAPFTLPDGTLVTITLTGGGSATASLTGNQVGLDVTGPAALTIKTRGGTLTLANMTVTGDLRSLSARTTTLAGTLSVSGNVGTVAMGAIAGILRAAGAISNLTTGNVSGTISSGRAIRTAHVGVVTGTIAAALSVNNLTAGALSGALILAGTDLGSDGQLGGSIADSYIAGQFMSLHITTTIANSNIAISVNPVDGAFGNSDDTLVGGGMLRTLTVRGGIDANSRFEAAAFPKVLHVPSKVIPASDPRFVIPSAG